MAPYYMLTEHTMGFEVVVMSGRAWQSLPEEVGGFFVSRAKESSKFMRQQWKDRKIKARRWAERARSVIIADFDRNPFDTAMGVIHDQAVNDPRLHPLVERIRQAQ